MSVKSKICGALLGVIVSMYSFNSYAQETIHVGTEPTFAPFGFVDDKTSEIVGLILMLSMLSEKLQILML